MKNIIFEVIAIVMLVTSISAQDLITNKNGEDIKAKVLEISQTEIKYKRSDNLAGPTYTISISDVLMIRYENGKSDVFHKTEANVPAGSKTMNVNSVACTDIDGNNYAVVTIGTQTWMAENLKTTHYADGTTIPLLLKHNKFFIIIQEGYCWYNNDSATYKNTYGALYSWYTVDTGKLAPRGWHVPTDADWETLENYLAVNGYNYDGTTSGDYYAKSLAATTNWASDTGTGTIGNDLSKNNRTGFSGLPCGFRNYHGFFSSACDNTCYWWSSTGCSNFLAYSSDYAWCRFMSNKSSSLFRVKEEKNAGFSVRCVKDN